jgi:5S rRNA maturation endonuclease (ribonuclease M5)
MREVLLSFGIPDDEITRTVAFNFFREKKEALPVTKPTGKELPVNEVPMPEGAMPISVGSSPWCLVAAEYLKARSLKVADHEWYVTDHKSYEGRLIIPYFFRNKIIYWQGRSMDDELIEPRYKNPVVEKDNIFFNMDEVYRYTTDPLFVTEGPIDAISIGKNAVALLGSKLTEFKINELRKAAQRRRVIFVLDKDKNGYKLGQEVLRDENLEWYVAVFPDNVEDANDALQKLGRLWIAAHLSTTAGKSFQGRLIVEMNCSKI